MQNKKNCAFGNIEYNDESRRSDGCIRKGGGRTQRSGGASHCLAECQRDPSPVTLQQADPLGAMVQTRLCSCGGCERLHLPQHQCRYSGACSWGGSQWFLQATHPPVSVDSFEHTAFNAMWTRPVMQKFNESWHQHHTHNKGFVQNDLSRDNLQFESLQRW